MPYVYPGPTAITSGLIVFMWIVYISPSMSFLLNPLDLVDHAVGNFFKNLSMYPLDHVDLPHLIVNSFAMFVLLPELELKKGTIRVGVLLNLFAGITGLVYSVLSLFIKYVVYHNMSVRMIKGSTYWLFTVYTWNCYRLSYKQQNLNKIWEIPSTPYQVKTLQTYPFLALILLNIIFYQHTSFWADFSGVLVGLLYFKFQHFFDVTLCLPRQLLLKIETLNFWTNRQYTGFSLAKFLRFMQITYVMEDDEPLSQTDSFDIEHSNPESQDTILPIRRSRRNTLLDSQKLQGSSTRSGDLGSISAANTSTVSLGTASSFPDFAEFPQPPSLTKKMSSHSPVRSRRNTLLDSQKPSSKILNSPMKSKQT
ncbi:hypothetical protein ACO0QE_003447 [Hanseniaspora vineae]